MLYCKNNKAKERTMLQQKYELTKAQRQLGDLGRRMMDRAVTERDDVKSNRLARVGNMLTSYGAAFGTRLSDFSDDDMALIKESMAV
jgi:hypothetical protein